MKRWNAHEVTQSSSGDVVHVFMSLLRHHARFSVCVLKENARLWLPFVQRSDRVIWVNAHHIRSRKSVGNEYKLWFCVKKHYVNLYYQRMWAEYSGEQISDGDFTAVPQYVTHSTAALLQTGTSILTLHRPFLAARYLSGLCFSGEHEQ